jgi:hypothetical protein
MTFDKLLKVVLNEKYFNYSVPSNVRVRIYDFYVLSYLEFIVNKMPVKNFREEDSELKASIQDAYKQITATLRKELLQNVAAAIAAEISLMLSIPSEEQYVGPDEEYITTTNRLHPAMMTDFETKQDERIYETLLNAFNNTNLKEQSARDIWKAVYSVLQESNISITRFVEVSRQILDFERFDWHEMYAGEAWQAICDGWFRLYNSKPSSSEEQVAIDHIFDLEHNHGSVLDKMCEYRLDDAGEYSEWLKWVLDHKRDAESMYELIPHASGAVSSMAQRALKERLGTTIQSSGIENFKNFYSNQERDKNLIDRKIQSYIKNGSVGDLVLQASPVTSLPNGLTVNGNLWLDETRISSLPENLSVSGDLRLDGTSVTSIPSSLTVGKTLHLDRTPIIKIYTPEQLREMLPNVNRVYAYNGGKEYKW